MGKSAWRVLIVAGDGIAAPALPASGAFGPFAIEPCQGLDAAAATLAAQSFDAIVFALSAVDARRLLTWPALAQAVAEPAVLVLTREEPGADLAMRLVQQGVQDVQPLALDVHEALPRALRLALERKALERSMRLASRTDLLTGLPNQAQLTEHMSQLLALREREPAPMVLLALRIEGLAATEARLGREAANALRRKVAVRLRVGLRAGDVVAALGHDLLGVLLARVQEADDAQRVAAKLVQAIKAPFALAGSQVSVALAIGAARYPQDGKEVDALLRRATGLAAAAIAEGTGGAPRDAANDPAGA